MKVKLPKWAPMVLVAVILIGLVMTMTSHGGPVGSCPGGQTYCPGVGCLSGADKCVPGAKGGASAVFSKEGFEASSFPQWPTAKPPPIEMKRCPGNYRSDGPCLLQF
jgi:hypothetical protein